MAYRVDNVILKLKEATSKPGLVIESILVQRKLNL